MIVCTIVRIPKCKYYHTYTMEECQIYIYNILHIYGRLLHQQYDRLMRSHCVNYRTDRGSGISKISIFEEAPRVNVAFGDFSQIILPLSENKGTYDQIVFSFCE
jgi:hypothetical protein